MLILDRHPDKHGSATKEVQQHAEMEFKKVAWAYEVIMDRIRKIKRSYTSDSFTFEKYWKEWESEGASWASFWDIERGRFFMLEKMGKFVY